MQRLHLLIRLSRQIVDERHTELGNLCRVRAETEATLAAHQQQIEGEYSLAAGCPESLVTLGAWSAHATQRVMALQTRGAELRRGELAARDALRDALADSRRLELAQQSAERESRREELRKAELLADERHLLARIAALA